MATPISGVRIATSFITHEGGATPSTQEIDFDMGPNEAIEIFGVQGIQSSHATLTMSTTPDVHSSVQTLHLEDDNPRDPGHQIADTDAVFLDDEIIYMQAWELVEFDDGATGGAFSQSIHPVDLVQYPQPIITAQNPTHAIVSDGADTDCAGTLLIHYRYVRLTQQELAFAIARRR